MRVLLVSSEPLQGGFGSGKFVRELASGLTQSGLNVRTLTSVSGGSGTGSLPRVGSKVLRKFLFDYTNPFALDAFWRHVNEFEPDVVHFNNTYGISSSLIHSASRSLPTVVTVHDYWPFCYFSTMIKKNQVCDMDCRSCAPPLTTISRSIRHKHLQNSVLVSPSAYLKERLNEAGFERVEVVPNGIHLPPKPSPDDPVILFIGRLVDEKGVEGLVNVAAELECLTHIIGTGPLAPKIEHISRQKPNIRFHGFVPDVNSFLENGGILAIPSTWPENQPFVALEALAHGLPIVASRIGGLPELVEDGTNGYLVDPGDWEGLARALDDLRSSESTRRAFSAASRAKSKRFSWQRTCSDYKQLYDSTVTA